MFARVLLHQEAEPQTKSLEDLEFQKLEGEINHAEESDSHNQELLREIAEYQRLMVTRKVQHRFLPSRGRDLPLCVYSLQQYAGQIISKLAKSF